MKASVIIRVKNEERWLRDVLESLTRQTLKDFEVIVVDSGSTDRSLSIVESFHSRLSIRVVSILPEKFTYPYACNVGAQSAVGEIIGYLSGHSLPLLEDYLESGLRHFLDSSVAGVYGPNIPLPDAPLLETRWHTKLLGRSPALRMALKGPSYPINSPRLGLLANTNSLLRRALWEEYPFPEVMSRGGEDTGWAIHWMKRGRKVIYEPRMVISHSHYLGLGGLIKQELHWRAVYREALRLSA